MRTTSASTTHAAPAAVRRRPLLPALTALIALVWFLTACSSGVPGQEVVVAVSSAADADMSDAAELEGAVLTDAVALEVHGSTRFVSVHFHVDDPQLLEAATVTAEERPFRVELDTTTLANGPHTLTITAEVASGRPPVVTKNFVVSNTDAPADDDTAVDGDPRVGVPEDPAPGAAAPAEGDQDAGEPDAGGRDEGEPDEGGFGEEPAEVEADEEAAPGDGGSDDGGEADAGDAGTDEGPGDDGAEPELPDPPPGSGLPAPTLFVSPDGDDGNDGRSASRPLRSVRRAASLVGPGDVVYLRGGVYPVGVEFTRSGTSSRPIVWASYPGEWAVFDGSGESPHGSVAKVHVRSSWNVFLNLEVRHAPQEGIYVEDGHDNVFRGIVTHGNQYSGIGNVRSDRNVYEDIVTYDNYDDLSGGQHADGIAISSGDGNTIRRVATFDNSDDGVDVWKSTNTRIEYVASFRNGRGSSGEGNGIKAGGDYGWNGTVVRHVASFHNRGNGFNENNGEGIVFENSTAFGNGGWDFMGGPSTTRRNNLAPASSTGMWGSPDERNSWNLGIAPQFESDSFGSDGFLVPSQEGGAVGAGVGGVDLGAVPAGGSLRDLVGAVAFGLMSSR